MCGESFQVYGVPTPRKCIESRHFYSCPLALKTCLQALIITPKAEESYFLPNQHFFENLFPPTVERGGGNYDSLYQNSSKKYEDDL